MSARYDMEVWQGVTLKRVFKWTNPDGTPVIIEDYTVHLHMRRTPKGPTILKASTDNGMIMLNGTQGEITLSITSKQMELDPASYEYDLVMVSAGGQSRVLLYGFINVKDTVTELV